MMNKQNRVNWIDTSLTQTYRKPKRFERSWSNWNSDYRLFNEILSAVDGGEALPEESVLAFIDGSFKQYVNGWFAFGAATINNRLRQRVYYLKKFKKDIEEYRKPDCDLQILIPYGKIRRYQIYFGEQRVKNFWRVRSYDTDEYLAALDLTIARLQPKQYASRIEEGIAGFVLEEAEKDMVRAANSLRSTDEDIAAVQTGIEQWTSPEFVAEYVAKKIAQFEERLQTLEEQRESQSEYHQSRVDDFNRLNNKEEQA